MPRIRICFSKTKSLLYTGTLDLQKIWERILRRADLPIQYSQGFHPQPKIQIACPLPLGMTSDAEIVDFWLECEIPLPLLNEKLNSAIHPGFTINHIELIPNTNPSLQSLVSATTYSITFTPNCTVNEIENNIKNLLQSSSLLMERRGKKYDLRPLIESLEMQQPAEDTIELTMQLSARPGATGRPDEVLSALGIPVEKARINRTSILFS